jgi:formylglycine-generating enzyme required for sulfatase activity
MVVWSFTAMTMAQDVSLSGTVSAGGGAGIAGARISLARYPQVKTLSLAHGAFTLSGNFSAAVLPSIKRAQAAVAPRIVDGRICFSAACALRSGSIVVYALNGAQVSAIQLSGLQPGPHAVALPRLAPGVYFVKLTMSDEIWTIRMVPGLGGTSTAAKSGAYHGMGKTGSLATDTLIFFAPGFKTGLVTITDYTQQGITTALAASNAWRPAGALERSGGMVKIRAKGFDFEMGQPDPNICDLGASAAEQPVHTVSFTRDFWMDTTEVSQRDFDSLMAAAYPRYTKSTWDAIHGLGNSYPAYHLTWGDAALYCNGRSKRDGLDTVYRYSAVNNAPGALSELMNVTANFGANGYRLPTEAEWEYACKGGTASDFYWAKNYNPYPATAADSAEISSRVIWRVNCWDLLAGSAFGTQPVNAKSPNHYGLYGMLGNLSEWCHDFWSDTYQPGPAVDPTGLSSGDLHIVRGGNWANDASMIRSTNRYFNTPDYPYFFIGFRAVRIAP